MSRRIVVVDDGLALAVVWNGSRTFEVRTWVASNQSRAGRLSAMALAVHAWGGAKQPSVAEAVDHAEDLLDMEGEGTGG